MLAAHAFGRMPFRNRLQAPRNNRGILSLHRRVHSYQRETRPHGAKSPGSAPQNHWGSVYPFAVDPVGTGVPNALLELFRFIAQPERTAPCPVRFQRGANQAPWPGQPRFLSPRSGVCKWDAKEPDLWHFLIDSSKVLKSQQLRDVTVSVSVTSEREVYTNVSRTIARHINYDHSPPCKS